MRAIKNKLEAFGSSNQHVRLMTSNELDKCLREALYSETVGCSDSILFDISQATYHDSFFDRIMKAAWNCVGSRASKIRRIQKGLNLLNYLAINGSERCISDIIGHIDVLHSLPKLKFGKNNTELSMLVIEKASQLSALVLDSKTLQDKRKYAASIRDRFVSVGSTNGFVETDVLHKPVFVLDKTKNIPQEVAGPNGIPLGFGGLHGTYGMHSRAASRLAMNQMMIKNPGRKFLSRIFRNSLKVSDNPHNMGLFGNQQASFADYQVTGANLGYGMGGYGDLSTSVNRLGTPNHSNNLNFGGAGYGNASNNFLSGSYTGRNSYNGLVGSNVSNFSTHEDEFNAFPVVNNTNDSYYKHSFAGARSAKGHKGSAKLGANKVPRAPSHNGSKSEDSSFKYHTSTDSDSSYSSSGSSSTDSESSYGSRFRRTHHRYEDRHDGRGLSADHRGRSSKSTRHRGDYNRRHGYSESSGSSAYSSSESEYESSEYYEPGDRHYRGHHHHNHHGHLNNGSYSGYYAPLPPSAPGHYYGSRYYSPEESRHLHSPNERPDFEHAPHGRPYSAQRRSANPRFSGNGYSTAGRGYSTVDSAAPRHNRNYHQHSDDYQGYQDRQDYVVGSRPRPGPVDSKYPHSGQDRRPSGAKYSHDPNYSNDAKYVRDSKYSNDKYANDRYDSDDKYVSERFDKHAYPDRSLPKSSIRDTFIAPGPVAPSYSRQQNPFTRA
ncbi:hypothetical protein MACK_000482 [Theileria orientalis]|uniref:ENTH domain-containing protein n=1 Tax=Theileria orientalis TaxID=68886 RepID=A0A976QT80_THEOR|nr:hypothetical protein MACK_000482 [Theileria orientalis]